MAWSCEARVEARRYNNIPERGAFRAGYSDGFHDYPMWSSNERDWYVNAYSAGYWEGKSDANPDAQPV